MEEACAAGLQMVKPGSFLRGKFAREHRAHALKTLMRVKLADARHADGQALHHAEDGIVGVVIQLLDVRARIDRPVRKSAAHRL